MHNTVPSNHRGSAETIHKSTAAKKRRRRRGPAIRFKFGMVFFIWFVCFVSCFAAYMIGQNLFPQEQRPADTSSTVSKTDSKPESSRAESKNDEEDDVQSQPSVVIKANPVPQGTAMSADYLKKCAFLGDLPIYRLGTQRLLSNMNVYSSESLRLDTYTKEYIDVNGSQLRMLSAISGASCPIYLMFGTETLAETKPEAAADRFSMLLNAVKAAAPSTEIFVLAVPPVTLAAEETISNAEIDAYNSMLLSIANGANVYFVDTNTALKNNEGKLSAEDADEDGIHLNAAAGQKLLDYVLCHVPA